MGVYFSSSALIILTILSIIFFTRKKVNNEETRIYSRMIIVSMIGLTLEIITCVWYKIGISIDNLGYVILVKITLAYYMILAELFCEYIMVICNVVKSKIKVMKMIALTATIISLLLPIEFIKGNNIIIPSGLSIYMTYSICVVTTFADIIICLLHKKTIEKIKLTPLYALLILGTVDAIVGIVYPQLFILGYVLSLVIIIMYFTIENPDIKMIEQLNIAKDQAERANRAKSDFLSSMSHEIRTPLNAIVGLSEDMASKDMCPEEMKEDLSDILSASHTLLEIVGNIMDINKIESEKMVITDIPYNFKEEITTLARVQSVRIGDKPIEMNVALAEDIPYELIGDKAHIKQIVNNLVSNAIKYTDEGKIDLTVKCINQNDICLLIISVKDTGRGIKSEDINKLFTKFERLNIERNTTTEGTGLGLAITKKLVTMMGGKINVESTFGKGSIFMVQLPQKISKMSPPQNETQLVDTNRIKLKKRFSIDYSNMNILVVDDNKLNIKVAKRSLQPLGFKEISECTNGQECIDLIKSGKKYNVILMDIMMPVMGGETALAELKKDPTFKTPVIALTADAIQGAEEKYKSQGFADYIAKPFSQDEIRITLDKIFENDSNTTKIEIPTENDNEELPKTQVSIEGIKIRRPEIKYDETFLLTNKIDYKVGVENFGSIEEYKNMLRDWLKDYDSRIMELKEYKNNLDMKNYSIKAHSLKSDSKYFGFTDLADIALEHELKSKEENTEYIKNSFYDLEVEYNRVCSIITSYIK